VAAEQGFRFLEGESRNILRRGEILGVRYYWKEGAVGGHVKANASLSCA